MERESGFCKIPIDPERLRKCADGFQKENEEFSGLEVNRRWIDREIFIAIWDIARLIATGTSFENKSRIILEYDPRAEKFAIVAIKDIAEQ